MLQEFLKQSTTDNNTGLAISLLGQLSAKDLRDVRLEVLNDHLRNTPAKTSGSYYYSALLNPRISTEELPAYKSFFRKVLDAKTAAAYRSQPLLMVVWCIRDIVLNDSVI